MNAGPELDAMIAEQVMGWKRMRWCDWCGFQRDSRISLTYAWHDASGKMGARAEESDDYYGPELAWSPSTNIAAALEVVSHVRGIRVERNVAWWFQLNQHSDGSWECQIDESKASAYTAQLAICLAIIKSQ